MTTFEPMVFTVPDGPAKAAFNGSGQQIGKTAGETAEALIRKILNDNLTTTSVVRPDERQFVSAMPEAHRKSEKAYHVKAFRGSKEGRSTFFLVIAKDDLTFISLLLTRLRIRVPLPSLIRYSFCVQEAPLVLLLRHDRFRVVYIGSPTHL